MTYPTFTHVRSTRVDSLNLTVEEYRHAATGARHLHLAASDTNNAFLVAFLTVPQDSTGVAHILEHTVLCGSERFPVRDPFFMMTRRSLNTFMNAFTGADWTAYPFATQNAKDFDNLLQVYLDAVFFPRLHPLDFAQEGHRVELASPEDPGSGLVFKGVVYNEMKGAMSAPSARLWQTLQEHLFPTTTYHWNSGGDPERIPDLTWEALRAFHASHYHPSNAVFMTYGDAPAAEHQRRLEAYALTRFEGRPMALAVPDERRRAAPAVVETEYPVDEAEGTAERTHVLLGWLLPRVTGLPEILRAHLLSGVLLDNSASPLRHALETTGLGSAPSELCGLDDSFREAVFACGVEGSSPEHAQAVEDLVLGVLREVARDGVPAEQVEAVLHQLELSQREIRGGHVPYGLRLMVNVLGPVLHGGDAAELLHIDPVLEELRAAVRDPGFVPGLVRSRLLDNPHRVRVVMRPALDLAARQAAREAERLAVIGAGLDDQGRSAVRERAEALLARQRAQDDPDLLPRVGLEDVPAELSIAEGRPGAVGPGLPATWYAQGTNGLVYAQVIADLPDLPPDLLDLLPLYCDWMTEVGCGARDYRQAQAWQASVTGGVSAEASVRARVTDLDRVGSYFVLAGKALARNAEGLAEVLREVFQRARFDELDWLRELVAQSRAQREQAITAHGHALAMAAAAAGMGPVGALSHRWDGLQGLRSLKALDEAVRDHAALERLGADLARLRELVLAAPRQVLVVSEAAHQERLREALAAHWAGVPAPGGGALGFAPRFERRPVREGWAVSSQVSFCARAYPAVPAEHPDAAALVVLGQLLTNGFLHRRVREEGGAYGAGASYDSDTGAFRFYSYRDPRLAETLADFDAAVDWLASHRHEPRALEEAILGVVAAIDRPEAPAGEAIKAFFGTLHGRTPEQRRRFRSRVLAVTLDDLRRVGATWLVAERASTAVLSDRRTLEGAAPGLGLTIQSA
jgi:hypothetical protein